MPNSAGSADSRWGSPLAVRVLVTGATGFVGKRLVSTLIDRGHDVTAMTRRPERYDGPGQAVGGDVSEPDSLGPALDGIDVAYYLVHSLDDDDFERKDAQAARAFGAAAAAAQVGRIVYLGGLGADDPAELSAHLRSRREVESLLGEAGVPTTVLRAAIVIGHGGISWEITRQLVKNLPAMVAPRWVTTRTQPIGLDDAVRALVAAGEDDATAGQVYDIGGPEAMTYAEMLKRAAKIRHGRDLPIVTVPLLTPRLSSLWIALVTDVDVTTARNLIDSMSTEVVVTGRTIQDLIGGEPMDYDETVRVAYEQRQRAKTRARDGA